METKVNEIDFLANYRMADPNGRLEIVFDNYHIFPKVICKMEKERSIGSRQKESTCEVMPGVSWECGCRHLHSVILLQRKRLQMLFWKRLFTLGWWMQECLME